MNLENKTVFFCGKLAALNRKEAVQLVQQNGGKTAKKIGAQVQILVVGEGDERIQDWNSWNSQLDIATREAFENGTLEIVSESRFWDLYNLNDAKTETKQAGTLYTPSMLAELSGLTLAVVRQLERKGIIIPHRKVHKLAYFRFDVLAVLKTARCMLDAGLPLQKTVQHLQKRPPHLLQNPVAIYVRGKNILYQTQAGAIDALGQCHFPFTLEAETENRRECRWESLAVLDTIFDRTLEPEPNNVTDICEAAWALESEGDLSAAVHFYRVALAAGGPNALINFQLAELFYRLGELPAARERYFMTIEMDETFVEARARLGCVLAEQGEDELATAAFRGALRFHPDYAEVHYHLGQVLQRNGLTEEAKKHFRLFLELMPDSPWSERLRENRKPCSAGED